MISTKEKWCRTCSTRHETGPICPGELLATGPERFGWRVSVANSTGRVEEFAVLVAPAAEVWRARVLTLPNMLWSVPGGRSTMKFAGRSAQEVEACARDYIVRFCEQRGLTCSKPAAIPEPGGFDREAGPQGGVGAKDERHLHSITVRFGTTRPEFDGSTADLSKGGLFVVTKTPLPKGTKICLTLQMTDASLPLRGVVAWSRDRPSADREQGMGVQLISPPALYQHYVARLAATRTSAEAAALG